MKRTREEDITIVTNDVVAYHPIDLLLEEIWINEIINKHIILNKEDSYTMVSFDALALSMVCKWFAERLWEHILTFKRWESHMYQFEPSVDYYLRSNPTSNLEFLRIFSWPSIGAWSNSELFYMNFARECFSRNATDALALVIKRDRNSNFLVKWLLCVETQEDLERLISMHTPANRTTGRLQLCEFFHVLEKFKWSESMLQWLAVFLEYILDCDILEKDKFKTPFVMLSMDKIIPYLRAILQIHQKQPNRYTPTGCLHHLNQIWDYWHGGYAFRGVCYSSYIKEPRDQRHRRVKTTIELALELDYPILLDTLLWEWPPDPPKKSYKKPVYSEMERLNILFGSLSEEKLFALVKNAPVSLAWLNEVGFKPVFEQMMIES